MKYTSILSAALLLLLLASCAADGEGTVTTDANTEAGTETEAVDLDSLTEIQRRKYMKDDLPVRDFGGKAFRISARDDYDYEIDIEEATGDICDDALFERNRYIEERFNVEIVPVYSPGTDTGADHINAVRTSITAGEDAFELAATCAYRTGSLLVDGGFYNWLDMPYNDLSKPWWIGGVNDKFRIGDAIYTVVGDMCLTTLQFTYAIFYNRSLGANYDLNEEIFDAVENGTWTIDYFQTLIADVYSDKNGNSTRDESDLYGFVCEKYTNLDVYPFSLDIPIVSQDSDGMPILVYNTEKLGNAIEKINELYWNTTGTCVSGDTPEAVHTAQIFAAGNAVFTTLPLGHAFTTFRDMKDDYSILPYPKWDEAQKGYYTGALDNYSVLVAPVTISDPEFTSIITESLNIESYKTLFPTYYEQALQNKYARDEESVAMIDLVMQGRNFDLSTLFASSYLGDVYWFFRGQVQENSKSYASAMKSIEKRANKNIEKIVDLYEENAEQ